MIITLLVVGVPYFELIFPEGEGLLTDVVQNGGECINHASTSAVTHVLIIIDPGNFGKKLCESVNQSDEVKESLPLTSQ